MASDSSNSVSVGLGQLVVEGKGLVGTVEYTLLEKTTPSGSKSSDLTVADVLFSSGGPESGRRVDYHVLQKQNAPLVLIHDGESFPCSIAGVGPCKATLVPRPKP
jgi:hypothetical protein